MREPRNDDPQRYRNERDQDRSMTTQRDRGQEDWIGYIQPYRYFGPGYRGVGYYSVFYQGSDPNRANDDQMDEPRTQFDQRNVQSGQGGGAGAAWGDRGRSWRDDPGAWRDRAREFGKFAGRGPKGYQRSDDRIREDVSDRLTEHPDIDASEIEVAVANGVVTLTGEVDSRGAKRLAEDIAEAVGGVRDVMNQLSVPGQFGGKGSQTGRSQRTTESTPTRQARNGRRPVTADR